MSSMYVPSRINLVIEFHYRASHRSKLERPASKPGRVDIKIQRMSALGVINFVGPLAFRVTWSIRSEDRSMAAQLPKLEIDR